MDYTLARSTGMHGSAVWNKLLTTKQSVIPFVGKSTEAGVVSSAVQPSVTSCSKKASASSLSSLAAAPNLRVTSKMYAQNVSGNIPPIVAVCAHPTHKGVDAQLHHALPTRINCETILTFLNSFVSSGNFCTLLVILSSKSLI